MKTFLIATAALSLMGGAAFAQANPTNNPIADSSAPAGVTQGGAVDAGTMPQNADGSPKGDAAGAQPAPSASMPPPADATPPAATTGDTGAMASTSATGAYPVCASKHQDHCVNRYQATRAERAGAAG